ncbi:MAG: hypothetical protein GW938_09720 [Leptospira sp.]|nr:hypothetical protein [Leptospira sp.]
MRTLRNKNEEWNFSGLDMDLGIEPSFQKSKDSPSKSTSESSFPSETVETSNKPSFLDELSFNETLDTNTNPEDKVDSISKDSTEKPQVKVDIEKDAKTKSLNEITRIEQMMKELETVKNRINSVLINIKSSRIFEITGDPSENQNIIGNLTRDFDVEAFQNLDKLSNYLKELISYPRAINYYTAKFERSHKDELRDAKSEKEKLDLVIRWEMQEGFTLCLEKLKALILSLLNVLNMKSDTHIKQLQYPNQLMFTDAKNAAIYCSQDVERLIRELEEWKYKTT